MATETQSENMSVEQQEAAKLLSKYPNMRPAGGSALLQKRMKQKGPKYFDSGDYNMAKAKMNTKKVLAPKEKKLLAESTGHEIPTPENVPHPHNPHRKPSLLHSKLVEQPADTSATPS